VTDGRLIAENGAMPPHPRARYGPNLVFPIPADLAHSGQPLSFVIPYGTIRGSGRADSPLAWFSPSARQERLPPPTPATSPPYVNGRELTLAKGLPLGLSPHEQYAESVFCLAADEQLTLMTDGVVEARATDGELLGFDRVKAMTTQSADSIVQAAQDFG
jgi:hypothetical protein